MKNRLVGAQTFQRDGRTDMTNLTVAFRNFLIKGYLQLLLRMNKIHRECTVYDSRNCKINKR
jgi:hypothetical protein